MLDRPTAMRLGDAWWARVCDTSPAALPATRCRERLTQLVDDLTTTLLSEPFSAEPAVWVGIALVELGLTDPVVMSRTATVLSELPGQIAPGAARTTVTARFPEVLGALGQGFAQGLYQRTLAGQEGIRQSLAAARRAAANAAMLSESRFRALFDNAAAAIFVSDLEGHFTEANPAMAGMLGRTMHELRGVSTFDFLHPEDRREVVHRIYSQLVPGSEPLRMEIRFRRGDGSYAWISTSLTLVHGTQGQDGYLIGVGEDVTEQRRLRDELYWQARHDMLTELPNRLYLWEVLDATIAAAGPDGRIGMCFLDLDGFKAVNDKHGHGVGDRLLAVMANRLSEAVADQVHMVARIGGDEFVALIAPPIVEERVVAVSRSLLAAVQQPIELNGRTLTLSASIGALSTKIGSQSAEAILDAADAGLYRAKADSRERISLQIAPSTEFPSVPGPKLLRPLATSGPLPRID